MIIKRKPTRTISGVTPIAVVIKPGKCPHGTCLYCPSLNVPQSYTPESPAILRARKLNYDAFKQIRARLFAFNAMKHPTDKIELIIMGGTFLSYPERYQYNFIKRCYDALNDKKSKNLQEAKKINEKAKHRCVALCIETRPDICGEKEIKRMLEFGATRCELGVQIIDDKIYKEINRGHTVKDVIEATKRLKNAGFKIGYHLMPNLPGSNLKKDLRLFKKLFSDSNYKPDQIKIYPCQVLAGSKLAEIYKKGSYEPYSLPELINLIIKMKLSTPEYCRIMRIMREIPAKYMIAGTKRIDLRKMLNEEMKKQNKKCKCIRCREIGFVMRDNPKLRIDHKIFIKKLIYKASDGKEIFIEAVNKGDVLFGLCRLRINKDKILMIRELHVYGPQLEIGKSDEKKFQHKGLGKILMEEAEKIAKKEKCKKIFIISGVGVRNYYKNIGYNLKSPYMVKEI